MLTTLVTDIDGDHFIEKITILETWYDPQNRTTWTKVEDEDGVIFCVGSHEDNKKIHHSPSFLAETTNSM